MDRLIRNGSEAHLGRPGQKLARRSLRLAREITKAAEHQRRGKEFRRLHTFSVIHSLIESFFASLIQLFFLGRLADQIGRRPGVLASRAIVVASAGVFLLAKHTAGPFPARFLSGLAIALSSGSPAPPGPPRSDLDFRRLSRP